jgi:N-acyl-D-aspartate/D-glutamate deacylase
MRCFRAKKVLRQLRRWEEAQDAARASDRELLARFASGRNESALPMQVISNDMNLALVQPWCGIGSDGVALATEGSLRRGHPHPRSFGTFPRVLGVYVREKGLLRLEDAVRRMTSRNAAVLGLQDRGLLRPGNYADLTLFDPERVTDRATYAEPFRYSEGIEFVIVNGQVVLDHGKQTGARPGRALRRRS